jgi:glycerate-2-kinase
MNAVPETVRDHLQNGIDGKIPETPKSANPNDVQIIVGSNALAMKAACDLGQSFGYSVHQVDEPVQGEAREAAVELCKLAKRIKSGEESIDLPALIIAGGETTVTLKGDGVGGRNQEMVLAAAIELTTDNGILFVSFGTDGNDGPTDAAGALADCTTLTRAREFGMIAEHNLDNNDSYSFFRRINDLIITGPTGSNVMDIQLIFVQ